MANYSLDTQIVGQLRVKLFGTQVLVVSTTAKATLRECIVLAVQSLGGKYSEKDKWKITFFSRQKKLLIARKI